MIGYQVPENFCDKCGECLDGAHNSEDPREHPTEGMLSICAYCFNVTLYDKDLRLVPASPEVLEEHKQLIADTIAYIKTLPFGGKHSR